MNEWDHFGAKIFLKRLRDGSLDGNDGTSFGQQSLI